MSNETPKLRRYKGEVGTEQIVSRSVTRLREEQPSHYDDYAGPEYRNAPEGHYYRATDVDLVLQAQAKRIATLEDILAEATNELQYMYASYHSHLRERDRREEEELIRRANEAIGDNDGR